MFYITAHYKFVPIAKNAVDGLQNNLAIFGEELGMSGLVILGPEGMNGTVAATSIDNLNTWKQKMEDTFGEITFKDSFAHTQPFKRWFVKIREEIVTLGKTEIAPAGKHNHITPEEWDRMIEEDDVIILDTRNTYETDIGMFEGAVDPKLKSFQEFPEYVASCDIPKNKKVLMYCTGGIRCEKACLEMEKQGFSQVYQLDGGILKYMQERPNGKWKGECFIFDHRVAVNKELLPTTHYHLCPHCGDPGDVHTTCAYCQKKAEICSRCEKQPNRLSCSKNCAHHLLRESQKAPVNH